MAAANISGVMPGGIGGMFIPVTGGNCIPAIIGGICMGGTIVGMTGAGLCATGGTGCGDGRGCDGGDGDGVVVLMKRFGDAEV